MSVIYLGEEDGSAEETGATDSTRVSKFVLISFEDCLLFVYGPLDQYSYHAELVKKYCDLNDIPAGWIKKPDIYEILSPSYEIKGGGWMEEKPGKKHLRVYGYSTAYGGFESKDIPYLLTRHPAFAGYEIELDH